MQIWKYSENGTSNRLNFFELSDSKALFIFVVLAILKISYMLFHAVPLFHLQTNELVVTAAQQIGMLSYDSANIESNFYHAIPSFIPSLEYLFLKLFHENFTVFLYAWCLFGQLIFCIATFAIGRKLSHSNWGGLLCFMFCSLSWFGTSTIGYGFMNFSGAVAPGIVMQGVGLALLALVLYEELILFFILLGVSFNLHPMISAIILSFASCYFLVTKPRSFKFLACGISGSLLLAIPVILKIYTTLDINTTNIDWPMWWKWMEITKLHHIFPWHYPMKLYGYLTHLFLFGVLIIYCAKHKILSFNGAVFSIVILSVSTLFLIISAFTVEFLKIPFFASAMIQRATVFTIPITCALIAVFILHQFKMMDAKRDRIALASFTLIILFAPILEWDWQIRVLYTLSISVIFLCLYKPGLLNNIIAYLICTLILLSALFAPSYFSLAEESKLYVEIAFVVLIGTRVIWPLIPCKFLHTSTPILVTVLLFAPALIFSTHIARWNGFIQQLKNGIGYTDYLQFTSWIKENTPIDAQILVPPIFNKADAASNRVILPNGGILGISMYKPALLNAELEAMQVIYGFDLTNPAISQQLDDLHFRYQLQQKYDALSVDQIQRIQDHYPKLQYVVFDVKSNPRFDFPYKIVDNTPRFIVYDLQQKIGQRVFKTYNLISLDHQSIAEWVPVKGRLEATKNSDVLQFTSNESRYDYQFNSKNQILLAPQKRYQLKFNGKIMSGELLVGILVNNAWHTQKILPADTKDKNVILTSFTMSEPSHAIVIIANNNAEPRVTTAVIRSLMLEEVELMD